MKLFLKRIVPVLLAVAIILCIGWYLLVYDRTFTRDMLLQAARLCDTEGYPVLASWFYDRAYIYSGNDESVAIELAHQYKADGNYTKAEYTLTNAIADDPTVELYTALCKTYVEQDKLLDAVNLLENIGDPVIKAQLDSLRPAAPVAEPEAGFYSQYIPVSLSCEQGILYYSTDGEYPSTADAPYAEPIVLPAGQTNIYAIAVDSNGLVSPVTLMAYTVGGVIEPVTLSDPAIDAAVREMLGIDMEDTLYTSDLWNITEFTVPDDAISFDDLAKMPYLKTLTIEDKTIATLDYLSGLSQLEELVLKDCRFPSEDQAILAGLPYLKKLTMSGCGLSTLADLEGAASLTHLDVSHNTIRNLSVLSPMSTLTSIDLSHNAVTDLSALSGLTNLQELNLAYNSISSLAPLATCAAMTKLDVSHNAISKLEALDQMVQLQYISLSYNQLVEVRMLGNCTSLKEVYLAYNKLTYVNELGSVSSLETLDISHNEMYEIPIWKNGGALRSLDASYNQLSSVATLWNMESLTYLYVDYNKITSLSNLALCPNLVQINAYGNKLEDLSGLAEKSIIVNYDPTLG